MKRRSLRSTEGEAKQEPRIVRRPSKKPEPEEDVSPEEQAARVKAHRIQLQAATASIQESINGLYEKKPKDSSIAQPISPRARHSVDAGRGDFNVIPEAKKAPDGTSKKIVSQRTSLTGEREPPRDLRMSSPERKDEDKQEEEGAGSPVSPRSPKSGKSDPAVASGGEESDNSSEISNMSEAMLESDDSDVEQFDVVQSREKVNGLLKNLNVEQRVEVMDFLNTWFSDRSSKIHYDTETLRKIEEERSRDYSEAENAVGVVGETLEATEEKTISMVRQMNQTLAEADIKPKSKRKRPKTGISDKDYEHLTAFNPNDTQNVQLELAIQQLRQKLIEKENEMRQASQATGGEDPQSLQLETDDLIANLNKQQDEIVDLNRQVQYGESRVKILKAALDHLSAGGSENSLPEKEVAEVIREMREKVHNGKMRELMAKREAEYGDELKGPDALELQHLTDECDQMRDKLSAMDDDILMLKSPEILDREIAEQLAAIKSGQKPTSGSILDDIVQAEVQPERAPEVKIKLHLELLKAQEEEDKLNKQFLHYQQLCEQAEKTLKTMEDQRNLFLDSVTTARASHWGSKTKKGKDDAGTDSQKQEEEDDEEPEVLIDTSWHDLFTQDESEDFTVETVQKQNDALVKLREEELRLEQQLKELGEKNDILFQEIKEQEEKRATIQEDLDDARTEHRTATYGEDVSPDLLSQVTELTSANRERLTQIRLQRQKLCGFDVATAIKNREAREEAESDVPSPVSRTVSRKSHYDDASDFELRIEAVKRAVEDQGAGVPLPDVDKTTLQRAMRSGQKPSEEELAHILAMQCSKDLRELLDVQAENCKLAKQVAALEEQIRRARMIRSERSKDADSEAGNLSKQKARELRQKQRELNALRAQWKARERLRNKVKEDLGVEDEDSGDQDDEDGEEELVDEDGEDANESDTQGEGKEFDPE